MDKKFRRKLRRIAVLSRQSISSRYVHDAMMKGECQDDKIAHIERLPDCLLLQILSLLNTCEAVETSVLSKRWKNLWKSVPRLDLDYYYFNNNEAFQNFVTRVLLLHKNKHIDKFHLFWFNCDMHRQGIIDTWMRCISELRPRDLVVQVDGVNLVWFPSYILSCVTLEKLYLYIKISKRLEIRSKMVNLPFLKSLSLRGVVVHEGIMNGLVSACPLLEELSLHECFFEVHEIVSQTLKELTISGSYTKLLRVHAPNLVYLDCEAPLGLISFESMPCLYDASVMLLKADLDGEYDENVVTGLHNLTNTRKLKLKRHVEKMLEKESQNCPTFRNLEILVFEGFSINKNLQPIASFLHLTPKLVNLRFIDITLCTSTREEEAVKEIQCCHLKAIEICGFGEYYEGYCELAKVVRENLDKAAESIVTINGDPV